MCSGLSYPGGGLEPQTAPGVRLTASNSSNLAQGLGKARPCKAGDTREPFYTWSASTVVPQARISAGLAAKILSLAKKWLKLSEFPKSPGDGNFVTLGAAISSKFGKRSNPELQVVQPWVALEIARQKVLLPCCIHIGSLCPNFPPTSRKNHSCILQEWCRKN